MPQQRKKNARGKPADAEDDLKTLYAKYRRRFTAADLAKYMMDEPTIPAAQVLAELREIARRTPPNGRAMRKKKGKPMPRQAKPKPKPRTGKDDLKALYAKYRRKFTAADLYQYTVNEPTIPFAQLIEELKELNRQDRRRRRTRNVS